MTIKQTLGTLLFVILAAVIPALSAPSGRSVHVTMQLLPTSLGFATVLEGGTTNQDVDWVVMVISNNDTAAHTIVVQDMATTPFYLFNGSTIPAKTTWFAPLNGVRFRSGMKWSVDSSSGTNATAVSASAYGVR